MGLVLGLRNGSSNNDSEGEEPQEERRTCGLHPQDLLVYCDVYNGGARALIPECAEAAYESLPTPKSNEISTSTSTSTSCGATDLARVCLALQLANYNDSVTIEKRSMFLTLATLYYSTDGPHWEKAQSWFFEGMSPCSWFGITCDPSGTDVVEIKLGENNLVGSLPTELGLLTKLGKLLGVSVKRDLLWL